MAAVLIIMVCIIPRGAAVHQHYDMLEVNSVHDDQGQLVFIQVLYCEWHRLERAWHVHDWRLLKDHNQVPTLSPISGIYNARWDDGGVMRHVSCDYLRKTATNFDPELDDRGSWPQELRRTLIKPDKHRDPHGFIYN